jgi:hypothetical protein
VDLKNGEIYFIREQFGDGFTEYTKIGKVAEKLGRNSLDRAKEHQTGNPRPLKPIKVVQTTFVSVVENVLHREFAPKRILPGEWFILNDAEIAHAIARCGELSAANAQLIPLFEQADALEAKVSNTNLAPANDEAATWAKAYRRARYGLKLFDDTEKRFKEYLTEANSRGVDVADFVEIGQSAGRRNYRELFEQNYPDLAAKYSSTMTEVAGVVTVKSVRNEIFSADEELAEVVTLTESLLQQINRSSDQRDEIAEMHALYLSLLSVEPVLKKHKEVARAHLMLLCGESAGIEELCTWRREPKDVIKIDWGAIKATHPAEVAACTTFGNPTPRVRIKRGSGYGYTDEEA